MVDAALFSSKKKTYRTPRKLFLKWHGKFNFTVDGAANSKNKQLERYWGPKSPEAKDSLVISWVGETVWLNPPYGRGLTGKWVKKAYEEAQNKGTTVVVLIPSRTCTTWWHDYAAKAHAIYFCRGRLHFDDDVHGAPFPSAILVFKRTKRSKPAVFFQKPRKRKAKKAA